MATRSSDRTSSVVDLSLVLSEELPCWWSTHMPFQHKTFSYFDDRGGDACRLVSRAGGDYQTRWMLLDEHTGTHVDAPAHFIPEPGTGLQGEGELGSVTVEQIPLDQLAGPAAVIDVPEDLPSEPGVSPIITPGLIEAFEEQHGLLEAGDVVLFRTGWDRHYLPGQAGSAYCFDPLVLGSVPGWPAPEPPAMRLLIDRGVRCVGTDAPSMGSTHDGGPVHREGLGAGVAYVEALAGLHQLPARGAHFVFAPINLARGTGAPGRAFAWLPDEGAADGR